MFGIWMSNIDLNLSPRYFDIALSQQEFSTGLTWVNSTDIPLVQCTPAHINFNAELSTLQNKFPIANGLCPSINQKMTVQGKFSSDTFIRLSLSIKRCSTTDPTCASDAAFNTLLATEGRIELILPIIKYTVNPSK